MSCLNIAIVTGGSGFIGTAVCHGLVTLSSIDRVAILDVKPPDANISEKIDFIESDLSEVEFTEDLRDYLECVGGRVSVVVHCAAFYGTMAGWDCDFEEESRAAWSKVFSTNTFSLFFLLQKLLGCDLTCPRLSLVNISSYYGSRAPNPSLYSGLDMTNVCSYGAAKAASEQIVRWVNGMFGDRVRGNSVALGGVYRNQHTEFLNRYNATLPGGRMAREKEVADLVAFLADSERSDYLAGQTIYLDGGKSSW